VKCSLGWSAITKMLVDEHKHSYRIFKEKNNRCCAGVEIGVSIRLSDRAVSITYRLVASATSIRRLFLHAYGYAFVNTLLCT
jgi:hypothetical protein